MRFLNDSREYQHGLDTFCKEIKAFETKNKVQDCIDHSLFEHFSFHDSLYTISFCEKGNDLNLWRGYCPKEGGIAIAFDTESIFPDKSILLNRCRYDNPYEGLSVESNYLKIKEKFRNIAALSKDREHIKWTYDLAHIKSEGFRDEKEWRGVSFDTGKEVQYYAKNSVIVPYFDQNYNRGSIKQIIIGPAAYQGKIFEAVKMMVEQYKLSCSIVKSSIPFVQY